MHSKLSRIIFASLLSVGTISSAFAGGGSQQHQQGTTQPAKGARLNPPTGTPLKPARMRVTKGNKLTTYRAESATIQNNPARVDPVMVVIDDYYGEGVALRDTRTDGIDLSQREFDATGKMKPLTPERVRTAITGQAMTNSTPLDKVGKGGQKEFAISQPANKPMAMVFTSDDVGHTGKQYTRIVKAKGKPRSVKIDTSGAFPVFSAEGGDLAGDFAPYLNTNVIGVTPAHYPVQGSGDQGQGQQQGGRGKVSKQARVVVRGGVNAIPPGSKYRIVNLTTKVESKWMDAHAETGSFRVSTDVSGLNDDLAIDVQTGTDLNESAIITTRYGFRSTYDAGLEAGKIPLLAANFKAGEPVIESAPHPVTGKMFKAAKKSIMGKIKFDGGYTFDTLTTAMGLSPAEAREFAMVLDAAGGSAAASGKVVQIGHPSSRLFHVITTSNPNWAQMRFTSSLAGVKTWVIDPEPADKPDTAAQAAKPRSR